MKRITKIIATIFTMGLVLLAGSSVSASEATLTIPEISNVSETGTLDAIDSRSLTVQRDNKVTYKFIMQLKQDSWVNFGGSVTGNEFDFVGADITIYSNSSYTSKIGEYGLGFFRYKKEYSNFLNKGTYYVEVSVDPAYVTFSGTDYTGKVNITTYAIPLTKVFNVKTTVSKTKNNATVTIQNPLGNYTRFVQYRAGAVALSRANDKTLWKSRITDGYYTNADGAALVNETSDGYSFKVTKNGSYTVLLEDINGSRYSKTFKVSGIDTTKPTVKGVKNKKTYKKAVKIKFSDKGSGIKSAKLNGKKIKSGKKVSKAGKYKLVVTDKAGNKKTIQFTIKKRK